MPCDNCRARTDPAYTLAAHPNDAGDAVVVDFCSIDCLQTWTTGEGGDFGRWRWGTDEALETEPAAPPEGEEQDRSDGDASGGARVTPPGAATRRTS